MTLNSLELMEVGVPGWEGSGFKWETSAGDLYAEKKKNVWTNI